MSGRIGRLSGRRAVFLSALGVGAVAVAAIAAVLLDGGHGSSRPATPPATALAVLTSHHQFLAPECAPVHGPRWVYPGSARISSTLYESFAISYPCRLAATWTKQMTRDVLAFSKSGNLIPINGPSGFSCGAWADASRHAYAGGCQKGNVAFGWNWNVANPQDSLMRGPDGRVQFEKTGGADTETILRPLTKDHYEVDVENTSGIGVINGFTWSPPPGWTVTRITKTTGGKCSLLSGVVSCSGAVQPPTCLCTGDGGNLVIDIVVSAQTRSTVHGSPVIYGTSGSKLRLTAMTPVPFLIPGTPAEAARQHGE
jgi:hypothetical protein